MSHWTVDENIISVDFGSKGNGHTSTCATSNGPALPVGECDCGGKVEDTARSEYVAPDKDPA